ncbi:MAG: YbbR-like domain-containing protein, partial [Butyricicoccus sp.]
MNFFKKHDIVLKIVALFVAVFLWSYVVLTENPAKIAKFPGVAVEMTGMEQLEERGLMLVTETEPKIDINVTGKTNDIVKLSASDIRAVVDFSDIQEASTYYMQPTVTVPKADSVSFKPQRLQFKVENIVTKSVPVKVTTMNDLSGDRLIDKLTPSKQKITVRG